MIFDDSGQVDDDGDCYGPEPEPVMDSVHERYYELEEHVGIDGVPVYEVKEAVSYQEIEEEALVQEDAFTGCKPDEKQWDKGCMVSFHLLIEIHLAEGTNVCCYSWMFIWSSVSRSPLLLPFVKT